MANAAKAIKAKKVNTGDPDKSSIERFLIPNILSVIHFQHLIVQGEIMKIYQYKPVKNLSGCPGDSKLDHIYETIPIFGDFQ